MGTRNPPHWRCRGSSGEFEAGNVERRSPVMLRPRRIRCAAATTISAAAAGSPRHGHLTAGNFLGGKNEFYRAAFDQLWRRDQQAHRPERLGRNTRSIDGEHAGDPRGSRHGSVLICLILCFQFFGPTTIRAVPLANRGSSSAMVWKPQAIRPRQSASTGVPAFGKGTTPVSASAGENRTVISLSPPTLVNRVTWKTFSFITGVRNLGIASASEYGGHFAESSNLRLP